MERIEVSGMASLWSRDNLDARVAEALGERPRCHWRFPRGSGHRVSG